MKRSSILLVTCLLAVGIASAQRPFSDVTNLLGRIQTAQAVAWGDVNNDGWPDLFVGTTVSTECKLYLNNHDGTPLFTDATAEYGLGALHILDVRRAQWIDVNNDGLLDLFVMMNNSTQVRLFRQIANHRFQSVSLTPGRTFTATVTSAAWVDMDGDGKLDLVLSNGSTYNEAPMVLHQRNNQFVQLRDNPFEAGLNAVGAMAFCDYDMNGQLDVFTGFGPTEEPAHLYRNMGDHYDDLTDKSHLAPKIGPTGAVWFDYNNDQWPDLFVPGVRKPQTPLYQNVRVGNERWLDPVQTVRGLTGVENATWADAVDVDMDGWIDLFIIKGNHDGCSLMMNSERGEWKDDANMLGIACRGSNVLSAAWADYDGDGAPDLAMVLEDGGVRLYHNGSTPPHAFIRVNLLGTLTNTPVTNVTAHMMFGNCGQVAAVAPMACSMSGDETTRMFVDRADGRPTEGALTVNWPNGMQQTYPIADLAWYATTNLHMPAAPTTTTAEAPELPVVSEVTVSPNPFNPTTNLSYTLPNAADVSLMIYNMLGQHVADLAHGTQAAGDHRVTFDASALPSGMYFSRLTVNGVPTVKRMMLAK